MIEAAIMETDIDLIKKANSQSPPIQSHIIRAKSDTHILSNLMDAGHYDAPDLDAVQAAKDSGTSDSKSRFTNRYEVLSSEQAYAPRSR